MSCARFQNYQRDLKKFNSYIIHRHKHFCNRATLVIALCHNTYYGEPRRSRLSGANAHNETSNTHTRACKKKKINHIHHLYLPTCLPAYLPHIMCIILIYANILSSSKCSFNTIVCHCNYCP